ncbi:MAG: hypothetical protein GXO00_02895, partial [Candidatus Diapherotrites archaeon]|nr:hypothetical protein [Candidatus Diapherotrites archaeon]
MKELVEAVKRRFPRGGVIGFTSFAHGMGRSYVKKKLHEVLSMDPELRERVVSLSAGDVFREIAAEMGFDDLNDFVRYLEAHPEEAYKVDTEIDRRIGSQIRELVERGHIVLLDSNLYALPHALRGLPHVSIVVYAR